MGEIVTASIDELVEESKSGEFDTARMSIPCSTGETSSLTIELQMKRLNGALPALSRDSLLDLIADDIESSMQAQRYAASYDTKQAQKTLLTPSAVNSTIATKKKMTSEEIFYATMNIEALSVDGDQLTLASNPNDTSVVHENLSVATGSAPVDSKEDGDDVPDASSFACLDMFKEERGMDRSLKQQDADIILSSPRSAKTRRGVVGKRNHRSSELGGTSHSKKSHSSSADANSGSSTSIPSGHAELSVTDIGKYVVEHLPENVKKILPQEAWEKLFREQEQTLDDDEEESVISTKSTKVALKRLLSLSSHSKPDELNLVEPKADDDDTETLVSELTSCTAAARKDEEQVKASSKTKQFCYPSAFYEAPSKDQPPKKATRFADEPEVCGTESGFGDFRKVSFDAVSVRQYERILCLNPSVTSGPPVGIGWKYEQSDMCSVDQWEMQKKQLTRSSTLTRTLILSRSEREHILHDLGYTQKDIAQAIRTVRKVKDQRRTTIDNLRIQSMEEAVENATNMMKNLLLVGRKKGLVRRRRTSKRP